MATLLCVGVAVAAADGRHHRLTIDDVVSTSGLDAPVIKRQLVRRLRARGTCRVAAPAPAQRVVVDVTISPTGSARVTAAPAAAIRGCIVAIVTATPFPKPANGLAVNATLRFRSVPR